MGGEDEVWEGEIEVWEGEDDWDENEGWENTADDGLVEGAGASSAANGIYYRRVISGICTNAFSTKNAMICFVVLL